MINRLLCLGLLLVSAMTLVQAREWTVTLTDYTGRGFPPDLVNYRLPAPMDATRLRVIGPDGKVAPVQVTAVAGQPATASFIAELPANAVVHYTLRDDGQGAVTPAARVEKTAEGLVLANSLLAVRVPAVTAKTFNPPVAANTLPAPILAFRGPDGGWRGAGALLTKRPVKAFRLTQTAVGPVFNEVRYELDFAGGSYYHAVIRVTDRLPLAQVTEEYDLGTNDGSDFWQLNLSQGWAPDGAEFMSALGQGYVPVSYHPLAELTKKLESGVNGMPTPAAAGENPVRLIQHDACWGARYVSYFDIFSDADRKANPGGFALAAVAPLHKGNWRRANSIPVYAGDKGVRICFPMGVVPISWQNEPGSDVSPFSAHEHDPAYPATYGRREWGLLLAQMPMKETTVYGDGPGYMARNLYGTIGLDRYKDFILSWPDKATSYPRVFLTPAEVTKFREAMKAEPDSPVIKDLKTYYWYTGEAATAKQELQRLKADFATSIDYIITSVSIGHHHTYYYASIASHADSLLSWPDLPAAEREAIRVKLALMAYFMVDADVMSHGDGSHHGNPNMGVSRQMDMLNIMALLPDHPQYLKWRDYMSMFMDYKTGSFMAPGGSWFEYGGAYHMHGYGKILRGMAGLNVSGAKDAGEMYTYNRQDLDYFLNLLSPVDPRFHSRMVPGDANSSPATAPEYLMGMGTVAERDPDFAANLRWAWNNNGQFTNNLTVPALSRPWIAPKEPVLTSRIYPGFGVIFRAHQGPDETYLFFRSGYNWSHWPTDQGHLILYSKGAPLLPCQPYQYYTAPRTDFDQYNILRFGDKENISEHGWADSNILDHAFGPTVDYAWSSSGYPDWYIKPGAVAPFFGGPRKLAVGVDQHPGAFTWDRQILFLKGASGKSPNYFVIRDTENGAGKLASWFNLNLLGRKENVQVTGSRLAVDTEWPTKLDVLFPGRTALPFDMYEDNKLFAYGPYNKITNPVAGQPLSRNWLDKDGKPALPGGPPPAIEQQVQLRMPGAPGEEYSWVLYPRGDGEATPAVTRLAPGVVKIVTAESTDYAFLSTTPITFDAEGVTFTGSAGSVRVAKAGTVTLALTGGVGQVGYKGYVITGAAPFEKTVAMKELRRRQVASSGLVDGFTLQPRLTGPQPVVPGVSKATADGITEYLVKSDAPVTATDGNVSLTARQAMIQISPAGIRFVVPERAYAQLSVGNVGVRGVGPFDLTFTAEKITGSVKGDTRTLVTTWPAQITRPMYLMDGTRWYAGFADEHSIYKGTPTPQFALALGVTDGPHKVEISEWVFPVMPPNPARKGME